MSLNSFFPSIPENARFACFTGHRPDKLGGYGDSAVKRNVVASLYAVIEQCVQNGVDTFITGMALGVDTWAGFVVLDLKKKYPHIRLFAYIPCSGQHSRWYSSSVDEWWSIIDGCDGVHYVHRSPFEKIGKRCMQDRNVAMVNDADVVIAVWDGTVGGTKNCVDYARTATHRPAVIRINPQNAEVTSL